jgi:3-deoxy-7-phosphoheptulonate synthase
MLITLKAAVKRHGAEVTALLDYLRAFSGVTAQIMSPGPGPSDPEASLEIYLSGELGTVSAAAIEQRAGVAFVATRLERYRLVGRHCEAQRTRGFVYNGVAFDDEHLHVFAGLCAVDTRANVDRMMRSLRDNGVVTSRMGAYKPRTSPYDFQGHGSRCLPYVFELAGKYGIRVVAMEVLNASHLDEIRGALEEAGRPTGVMLQVGTRNAQNFELLKLVGQQGEFPVLYKRGMGNTLSEAVNACEYIASAGNRSIVFCLRGVKTQLSEPHRNLVDFAQVPVVRRLTRMPVCIDPSHSVGGREAGMDGVRDIAHAAAQGIIAGATMVLVDFHPDPGRALCDAHQALMPADLPHFLADAAVTRRAYLERRALVEKFRDRPRYLAQSGDAL